MGFIKEGDERSKKGTNNEKIETGTLTENQVFVTILSLLALTEDPGESFHRPGEPGSFQQ